MQLERRRTGVYIWWGDRYVEGDDDEPTTERSADLMLTHAQANELVVELLRGPTGPTGPQGPGGRNTSMDRIG